MAMNRKSKEAADMKRNSIRKLLVDMTDHEIDKLAAALPLDAVTVLRPPVTGLVMAKVQDCFQTEFYLGEVLTTRAEVKFKDCRAQATVMGCNPKKSLMAAILDVMAMSGRTDILDRAAAVCEPAAMRIEQNVQTLSKLTAATRVQFESMAEEA